MPRSKVICASPPALLFILCALVLVFACAIGAVAFAQSSQSLVTGSVRDNAGARISQATVSVSNIQTGLKQTVLANRSGAYSIPNLVPGSYELVVSADTFATKRMSGINLIVGGQEVIDVTLDAAANMEEVQVGANLQDLQFESSAISGLVTGETIRELPLNGRSFSDLALLQPGVAPVEAQPAFIVGTDRGNRGFGSQFIISGARPQQNLYLLNGTSINDYSNGSGSVSGGNLGVDAVSEFSVITTNAPAEYGRTAGGIINAVTRNGTNSFHGSGYEFARNSALDAKNYFDDHSKPIPYFSRNQFGGTIGGPIKKSRTFFFANYEGIRQNQGNSGFAITPTQAARNGTLHQPVTDPVTGQQSIDTIQVAVDPSAAKYLPLFPLPNNSAPGGADVASGLGDLGSYTFSAPQVLQEDFAIGRIDHQISEKDSIYGTYEYDRTPYTYPDSLNDLFYLSKTARQIATVQESHIISANLVNTARVGLNRDVVTNNVPSLAINPLVSDPSLGAVPGFNAAQVGIGGITGFAGGSGASGATYGWTSYQFNDDVFLTRGSHALKAGFATEIMRLNIFNNPVVTGQFQFSTLQTFLTNQPLLFDAAIVSTVTPRNLQEDLFAGYAQDDWRVNPSLTVNYGVRYETVTVPHEAHGRLSTLRNLTDATPHLGDPFFNNPTHFNIEPRVGFSAAPFGSARTVVHGAFGLYDVLPLPYQFILPATGAAPFTQYGLAFGNLPQGSFYAGANALLGPFTQSASYVQPSPKRNYVMEYNLNVQHEFPGSLSLLVGYVGTRGLHQPYYSNEYNIVLPTKTPQGGYQWPLPIGSGTKLNPHYGGIRGLTWNADSYYDGLQIGLNKDLKHGVQFQVSYTWSKSIDNTSSSLAPDAFGNSVSTLPFFDPARSRGPSDFNIGRVLVVNGIVQIPGIKASHSGSKLLTNGWQVGAILSASDGIPFTPTYGFGADPLGSGGLQDFPDRVNSPACSSLIHPRNPNGYVKTECFTIPAPGLLGNAGRNIITGPGVLNLDGSIFKNVFAFGDRFKLQLRAESFNILNHTNFALPATSDVTVPTAGIITQTQGSSRQIQLGVKGNF